MAHARLFKSLHSVNCNPDRILTVQYSSCNKLSITKAIFSQMVALPSLTSIVESRIASKSMEVWVRTRRLTDISCKSRSSCRISVTLDDSARMEFITAL